MSDHHHVTILQSVLTSPETLPDLALDSVSTDSLNGHTARNHDSETRSRLVAPAVSQYPEVPVRTTPVLVEYRLKFPAPLQSVAFWKTMSNQRRDCLMR